MKSASTNLKKEKREPLADFVSEKAKRISWPKSEITERIGCVVKYLAPKRTRLKSFPARIQLYIDNRNLYGNEFRLEAAKVVISPGIGEGQVEYWGLYVNSRVRRPVSSDYIVLTWISGKSPVLMEGSRNYHF